MHVHESSTLYNSVAWNSELLISESTNAKRLPWVYPLCVDRSSCFPYRVLTKTDKVTDATDHSTNASTTTGIGNKEEIIVNW